MQKSTLTPQEALTKLMDYCSRMERSAFDVRQKLYKWQMSKQDSESIIDRLYDENFLSDERYLASYIKGKFIYNKWGKIKIKYNLKLKGFPDLLIENTIDDIICDNEYEELVSDQIRKKNLTIKDDNQYSRKAKLLRYAQSRGYDTPVALSAIETILINN